MYGEFEKIGENKYSYVNSHLDYEIEFNYDGKNGVEVYFDDKQKLIEDTFYMDFEEYFNGINDFNKLVEEYSKHTVIIGKLKDLAENNGLFHHRKYSRYYKQGGFNKIYSYVKELNNKQLGLDIEHMLKYNDKGEIEREYVAVNMYLSKLPNGIIIKKFNNVYLDINLK